jgi:hypothetical protein
MLAHLPFGFYHKRRKIFWEDLVLTILFTDDRDNRCSSLKEYINKKTPWPELVSELYRPSDRSLSVKLVPTSADGECRVVSMTDPAIFSTF